MATGPTGEHGVPVMHHVARATRRGLEPAPIQRRWDQAATAQAVPLTLSPAMRVFARVSVIMEWPLPKSARNLQKLPCHVWHPRPKQVINSNFPFS